MGKDDDKKTLDNELSSLTYKINEISIETEAFLKWRDKEWIPFVKEIKNEYGFDSLSDSLKYSLNEYFNEKFHFIRLKLLTYSNVIMSICLRQLFIDIYKYNFYIAYTCGKNSKSIAKDKDQYFDNDEKFSNSKNEKQKYQEQEKLFFSNSNFIKFWAETLFKNFGKNYKEVKEEIEYLKNHLSKSLHSNSILFFNSKLSDDKEIDEWINEKINLIKDNLMVYDRSNNCYKILDSNKSLEYKKFKMKKVSELNLLLSSFLESIKNDFSNEYHKLVEINNLKG